MEQLDLKVLLRQLKAKPGISCQNNETYPLSSPFKWSKRFREAETFDLYALPIGRVFKGAYRPLTFYMDDKYHQRILLAT